MFEIQHKNYPEADDTSLNNSDWSMKKWSVDFFYPFCSNKKKSKKNHTVILYSAVGQTLWFINIQINAYMWDSLTCAKFIKLLRYGFLLFVFNKQKVKWASGACAINKSSDKI